ncbi:MAG: AsmA family protein [Rhodospirillales bacterium]|nr:AsmA family protein [Rhodospirillales bacterium]
MKRLVIVISVVVLAVLGLLVMAPGFVDWNKYKPQIISQIKDTTGYEVKIDGGLSFAVVPFPRLMVENLSVATAAGGTVPFISLDRAEVSVALMPLLSREVIVNSVLLVKPDILVEVAKDGSLTAMTDTIKQKTEKGKSDNAAGPESAIKNVALNEVKIRDGRFHYLNHQSGQDIVLDAVGMTVKGDSLQGPFAAETAFSYKGQKVEADIKTGRIDDGSGTVALQLAVNLPDSKANVSYSGIVTTGGPLELQGEFEAAFDNLAAALALADVPAQDALKKAVQVKGMLTFGDDALALKTLSGTYDGVAVSGNVNAKGLKSKLLQVSVALESAGTLNLDAMMSGTANGKGQKKDGKTAAQAAAAFLPETMTVPMDIRGTAALKAAGITVKGVTYTNVALALEKNGESALKGTVKAAGPGAGKLDSSFTLSFGAVSRSLQSGQMVYSEPLLSFDASVATDNALQMVAPYLQPDQVKQMNAVLSRSVDGQVRGKIVSDKVSVEAGRVTLDDTKMNFSGSFALGKKPVLSVNMEGAQLDVDGWKTRLQGGGASAAAVAAAAEKKSPAAGIKDMTDHLKLPFDLNLVASLQNVKLDGRTYQKIDAKGALTGDRLSIETLNVRNAQGDSGLVSGKIGSVSALSDIDLSVSGKTPDVEKLVQFFNIKNVTLPAHAGDAELVSEFKGKADNLSYIANVKALRGSAEARGVLTGLLDKPDISELTLRLRHPNYVDLINIFKPSFTSRVTIKKSLDLFIPVKRAGDSYNFNGVKAEIGPVSASGDIVLKTSGVRPAIKATMAMNDVPLDSLLGHQPRQRGTVRATTGQSTQKEDIRWSRNAIDTGWMHAVDLDMAATATSLSYGTWTMQNVDLDMDMTGGILTLKKLNGAMHGGQVALNGVVKSSDKPRQPLSMEGDASLKNVSLESFVKSFSGSRLVQAKGTVSLDTSVKSTGLSPAALIFDLQGKGASTGQNLIFEGFDLARLSRALSAPTSSFTENFGKILEASTAGGSTAFDTLDAAFTINEGGINFDKLLLSGADADVTGTGNVNLPLWTIDLTTVVDLKEPADAPDLKTVFRGPLDNPGKTFAQNALNQYFNKQLEGLVLNPLLNKLQKEGILQAPAAPAPAPSAPTAPTAGETPQTQQQQQVVPEEPKPAQPVPQSREISPEDALFGILQNVIEGAR